MSETIAGHGASLRVRLREKLPEILIEAASVVIALLLALALNSWNDARHDRERATAARAAILAELRGNRVELAAAQSKLKDIVAELNAALDPDKPEPHELKVELGVSLLSSAAWHAALATQASQDLDFDWIRRIARVYELQDNYLRVQNVAVDQLGAIPADESLSSRQVAQSLIQRMIALSQLAGGLARSYDDALGTSSE